jgi:hypothetical protein
MRALILRVLSAAVVCGLIAAAAVQARPRLGNPPRVGAPVTTSPAATTAPCTAAALRATYSVVFGSNATGHVQYLLTITNRSAATCTLAAPPPLTLLGGHGQALRTHARFAPSRRYTVTLESGQSAQDTAVLSPDLYGPGEPAQGNCEPIAHALRIGVAGATVREQGAMYFERLAAVPVTPVCSPAALHATFHRPSPPFSGYAGYFVKLRNTTVQPCHTSSVVGLTLLTASGRRLPTRVQAGTASPFQFAAHATETAYARVATSGGHCDARASTVAITPTPGAGSITASATPAVRACRRGLIVLSTLYTNG